LRQLQRLAIAPAQLQAQLIELTQQQQHYLNNVLRLQQGDRFIAMNGLGQSWLALLAGTKAEIIELISVATELPANITLMMALPKGNSFDEVVRCCTELGVACFIPVVSDRSLLIPSSQKLERWRRIASEAAEQSERSFVPTVLEPVSFATGLATATAACRYICVARGSYPHLGNVLHWVSNDILIATGPEGGWTTSEVESAVAAQFQPVSLGARILRAVTAPVVALSLLAAAWETSPQ